MVGRLSDPWMELYPSLAPLTPRATTYQRSTDGVGVAPVRGIVDPGHRRFRSRSVGVVDVLILMNSGCEPRWLYD